MISVLLIFKYTPMRNMILTLSVILLSMFSANSFAAEGTMMDDHKYNLENVTWDATIRWIVTSNDALWHASVSYTDGDFVLHAEFDGLTDPQNDDFYEGWLVQKSPFKFISTGELKKVDGNYVNHFESETDYRSYDFYVLTLEPNDGDPAPADHIFEGTVLMKDAMMKKEHDDKMMMKEDSPKRKLLKMSVQKRLSTINLSVEKIDIVLERIENLEEKLPTLRISESKKLQYVEILSVLKEILLEKKDTMMQK